LKAPANTAAAAVGEPAMLRACASFMSITIDSRLGGVLPVNRSIALLWLSPKLIPRWERRSPLA